MEKYIITISRQFGSMGRSVASELARRLNVEYLDRDIVEETAKRMELPVSQISNEEEAMGNAFFRRAYPLGIGNAILKDKIYEVQKHIITDFANAQSGIIVGRCAEYILKDHPNVLSVYIYASEEQKLQNCITRLGMDIKTAKKMMTEVDLARENYHKSYIPGYKNPFNGKHICIDSGAFGVEGTVDILEGIIKRKFGNSNEA